ncbi:MAG: DUF167 domain-containing protein [Holosporales bacterium]|jgi:uncharacterized protein (TIGR00251 family)|nr:DUF167 domain-containing protein [Holosporales bacterium]
MLNKIFENRNGGLEFLVYLTPGASREEIIGIVQGGLKIAVHAKPTDNQANRALIAFISSAFRIAPSRIAIRRGQKSRTKTLLIEGLDIDDIPDNVRDTVTKFKGIQNRLL